MNRTAPARRIWAGAAAILIGVTGCSDDPAGPTRPVLNQPELAATIPGVNWPVTVDVRSSVWDDHVIRLDPVTVTDVAARFGFDDSGEGVIDGNMAAVHVQGGIVTVTVVNVPGEQVAVMLAENLGFGTEPVSSTEWQLTVDGVPVPGLTVNVEVNAPVVVALMDAVTVGTSVKVPTTGTVTVAGAGTGERPAQLSVCEPDMCVLTVTDSTRVWVDTFDGNGQRWLAPGVTFSAGESTVIVHTVDNQTG